MWLKEVRAEKYEYERYSTHEFGFEPLDGLCNRIIMKGGCMIAVYKNILHDTRIDVSELQIWVDEHLGARINSCIRSCCNLI